MGSVLGGSGYPQDNHRLLIATRRGLVSMTLDFILREINLWLLGGRVSRLGFIAGLRLQLVGVGGLNGNAGHLVLVAWLIMMMVLGLLLWQLLLLMFHLWLRLLLLGQRLGMSKARGYVVLGVRIEHELGRGVVVARMRVAIAGREEVRYKDILF